MLSRVGMLIVVILGTSTVFGAEYAASGTSCQDAQQLVKLHGSIMYVLPHAGYTELIRIFATTPQCSPSRVVRPMSIQAQDSSKCFVGYQCASVDYESSRAGEGGPTAANMGWQYSQDHMSDD